MINLVPLNFHFVMVIIVNCFNITINGINKYFLILLSTILLLTLRVSGPWNLAGSRCFHPLEGKVVGPPQLRPLCCFRGIQTFFSFGAPVTCRVGGASLSSEKMKLVLRAMMLSNLGQGKATRWKGIPCKPFAFLRKNKNKKWEVSVAESVETRNWALKGMLVRRN